MVDNITGWFKSSRRYEWLIWILYYLKGQGLFPLYTFSCFWLCSYSVIDIFWQSRDLEFINVSFTGYCCSSEVNRQEFSTSRYPSTVMDYWVWTNFTLLWRYFLLKKFGKLKRMNILWTKIFVKLDCKTLPI